MTSARRKAAASTAAPDVPAPRWDPGSPVAQVVPAPPGELTSHPELTGHPEPASAEDSRCPESLPDLSQTATRGSRHATARHLRQAAVGAVLAAGGPRIVYQPQLSLSRMELAGYEALSRFPSASPGESARGTHTWFSMAQELGLGDRLEAIALSRALARRDQLPAGTTLAVNISPAVLARAPVVRALPDDLTGIEIELTEHEWAPGVGRLRRQLDRLRERGARVAIDDVGVAHSGLRRVMELAPDRIKLDRHLVLGVSTNTAKAALIKSVVDFAEHVRCDVCAEGVENLDDLEALAELDVGYAQGWAIGMPDPEFLDVNAAATATSRDSLRGLLASPVPATFQFDATIGVEHLLSRLASVTSLDGLARLTSTYAGVLGADLLEISVLSPDRSAVEAITGSRSQCAGKEYRLDDFPLTRQALLGRTIAPVYLDGSTPLEGDAAEWGVLREMGMQSALLVPVISQDAPIGLLECYAQTPGRWTRRQIRSARTVAAMLGPVLDLLQHRP